MKPDSPVVNDACAYNGPEIDRLHIAGEGALSSYLPGMPPDNCRRDTAKWGSCPKSVIAVEGF